MTPKPSRTDLEKQIRELQDELSGGKSQTLDDNHLRRQLNFQTLVAEFSTHLIRQSASEFENSLDPWLKRFAELLDVDRISFMEISAEKKQGLFVRTYVVPGVIDIRPDHQPLPLPYLDAAILRNEIVKWERIPRDLPPALQSQDLQFVKDGAKSFLAIPMIAEDVVIGVANYGNYRREKQWSTTMIDRLRTVGEIVANALLRKRFQDTLMVEIDKRKRLEERNSAVLSSARLGFWVSDLQDNIREVNDAYCQMTGYSREEILAMKVFDLDIAHSTEQLHRSREVTEISGHLNLETRHRCKDGRIIDLDVSSTIMPKENRIFVFFRDITARKKHDRALQAQLRFQSLISDFSAALMEQPPEAYDQVMGQWIEKIAHFLNVDRIGVAEFVGNQGQIQLIHDYSHPDYQRPLSSDAKFMNPVLAPILMAGEPVILGSIPDDLPASVNPDDLLIVKEGTKSFLSVPLKAKNTVMGALSLGTQRRETDWPEDQIRQVKLISNIIAGAQQRKQIHENLVSEMRCRRQVEERNTTILKSTVVGFWIADVDGGIVEVNEAICRILGYARDELLSMKVGDLDMDRGNKALEQHRRNLADQGSTIVDTRFRCKNGSWVDLEIHTTRIPLENQMVSFFRDVTAIKKAEQEVKEQLQFEALISDFSAALINLPVEQLDSALEDWLKRLTEFLGVDRALVSEYTPDKTHFRMIQSYSKPFLAPLPRNATPRPVTPYLAPVLQGETIIWERIPDDMPRGIDRRNTIFVKTGTKSALFQPLAAGGDVMGTLLLSTFREEKKWPAIIVRRLKLVGEIIANALLRSSSERELTAHRHHLEDLVAERTRALQAAQDELVLQERLSTLGKLTATVSHELRNPLGTIRSSLYSIKHRFQGEDVRIHKALDRATKNVLRCDRIIDELLNFARSSRLELAPTELDVWLDEVLEEENIPAGISLIKQMGSNACIDLDQERLRRCIINVITNGCQAIEQREQEAPQGKLTVWTRRDENEIVIGIEDNGVGISEVNLNNIFEPLFSTKSFGVGLGIPIAQQIMVQHGGNMTIESQAGHGTQVCLRLPLPPGQTQV